MRLIILLLALVPTLAAASGGDAHLMKPYNDLGDKASLQNGAKLFMNYCMSCHSAEFMRFSRLGKDLGIDDEALKANLMFAADKVGEPLRTAMNKNAAEKFFGVVPPDLSVVARSRGPEWLYTYLLGFYKDDSRPTGVNNLVFKDVGMPHILLDMQGMQEAVYRTETDAEGKAHQVIDRLELAGKGQMSPEEYQDKVSAYKRNARDLVNFMEYLGEPAKLERYGLGVKVILFLIVFTLISYLLKREYWRDVH